jgi:Ca2+-binding RTX toxin-like protein
MVGSLSITADVTEMIYDDTAGDDIFANTAGQISASDALTGDVATYGIDGGTTGGSTTVDGHVYDVARAGAFGTLYVDSVAGAYVYVPNEGAIEGLKTTDTDVFTLTGRDALNATDAETLTITLNGVNDAPVATASPQSTYINPGYSTQSSITLTLSDRDTGDTPVYDSAALGAAGWYDYGGVYRMNGSYGSASLNPATNVVAYSINYYALNTITFEDGVSITDSFTIPVRDDDGATTSIDAVFTIPHNHAPQLNATLTNPVIVETAGDDTFGNLAGIMSATDLDADATFTFGFDENDAITGSWLVDGHTYDVSRTDPMGTMYVDSVSGEYTIVVNDAAVEGLKDTGFISFMIQVVDNQGAKSSMQVADGVYGTDDTPTAVADTGSAGENETKDFNVVANDTDRDVGDTALLTLAGIVSATSASSVASVNGLNVANVFTIVGNTLHFKPGAKFDALGDGDTATVTVTYTVSDGALSATATETITINGAEEVLNGTSLADVLVGRAFVDTINGLAGDDHLAGGGGNDILNGGDGDDVLDGGGGYDTMSGGAGNDTYFASKGDVVSENPDEGIDLVNASSSFGLGANVENLNLSGTASSNGTGNALDNTITGNAGNNKLSGLDGNDVLIGEGGNNTLLGGAGDDFLVAGSGNDTLSGRSGNDTVSYANAGAGVSVNLTLVAAQSTGGSGSDKLSFVENIVGSAFADTLIAGNGTNILTGGLGGDSLTGGSGADHFVYDAAAESTGPDYDTITDISLFSDMIYLPFAVTGVDAKITGGPLSLASFDADMAAAVNGAHLGIGHAVAFKANIGSLAGETFLVIDANGVAGYQAGADFVIHLQSGVNINGLDTGDFGVTGQ